MTESRQAPIRVAFIGTGGMGREHARAFAAQPGIVIAGFHNRSRAKAETLAQEHGGGFVADSIGELFERGRPDLAVIAVPEMQIAAVMAEALRFPWAILMEKPIGYDLADGEAIARTAREAGARVMVGLNRRFLASTRAALADLAEDASARFIHVQDQQSLAAARSIGHPEAIVRNWMYANSIHLVDYLTAFGRGAVTKVEIVQPWQPEAPGVVLAKVEFASGDLGLYEGIWNGPGPWACAVTTARRRWEMRPLEKAVYQNSGERALNSIEAHPWDSAFKPGFRLQAEQAVASLRGLPSDIPDIEEGMRSMRLVHDIFAA